MLIKTPEDISRFLTKVKQLVNEANQYEYSHPKCDRFKLYSRLDNNLSMLSGIASATEIAKVENKLPTIEQIYLHLQIFTISIIRLAIKNNSKETITPEELKARLNEILEEAKAKQTADILKGQQSIH